MEERVVAREAIVPILQAMPFLIQFPSQRFWVDYDAEVDVLYISFERPQRATESVMTEEGILLRYRGERLVGVTVLDASTRTAPTYESAARELSSLSSPPHPSR